MTKRWKKEELTYLRRYAKQRRVMELAQRFKTDTVTVLLKLKELDVHALDSVEPTPLEGSHQLELFERAIKTLHAEKWVQAVTAFERVIAESDQPDLINRAKRYLTIARDRAKGVKDVAADDPYLQATYERNRGNFDAALAIASAGGRRAKDPRFAYLVASIHIALGDLEVAAEYLRVAIQLDPMSRVHAHNDAEFSALRQAPEYADLFAS